MADNIILNEPTTTGATIATDEIASVQHQLVKLEFGEDGVATKVSASDPLPITGEVDATVAGTVAVSNFPATQPVSGTVNANTGLSQPLTDTQLRATPVPVSGTLTIDTTGLATEDKQDDEITQLAAILAKLSADPATQTTLAAILAKLIAAPSTESKQDTGNTSLATIAGKDFATQTTLAAVLAKIIAAPSTEAKQDTGNTSLSSIDTKTPALGQALAAASTPVVLTAAQLVTLTPPAAITNFNLEATQLLVRAKTDNLDVALSTRLKAADTLAAVTLISDVRQATAGNLNMTEASAASIKTAVETIDNFISGARGLVTEDNSASIKTAVELIDNFISGSRGLVTEDNSAAILAKIIAAPATEAKQDTGNTSLATIAAKDFATQTTLAAFYAAVALAQGADAASTTGPMMQGLVNDVPGSYLAGQLQPISLTSDGRLRVSSVIADINNVWNNTFDNPFFVEDVYVSGNNYFNK